MSKRKGSFAALGFAGLLVLVAAASALASAKTGSWKGTTSEGAQITFSVVKFGNGKDVQNTAIQQLAVTCTGPSGSIPVSTSLTPSGNFPIKHNKFKFKGPIDIKNGTVKIAQGNGKITGKFAGSKSASGTFHFSWHFNNNAPPGLQDTDCTSGNDTYTATHK